MDRRVRMGVRIVLVGCGLCWPGLPQAAAAVFINEILADPPSGIGDANGDGLVSTTQDEFVELVNTGPDSVSLAGWQLSDALQVRHTFSSSTLIPAYDFFVVFGGGSPQGFANVATASTGGLSLNNSGDTLTLRDAAAALIDTVTYGSEGGHDVSLTRSPDATGAFVLHNSVSNAAFSPGRTVDGSTNLPRPEPSSQPATDDNQPTIPEPASLLLWGMGLLGFPLIRRPH